MTQDGRRVFGGIFQVSETIGLPLVVILECLKNTGDVVDWVDYVDTGLRKGMNSERLLGRISGDVNDVYGSRYRDEVIRRLKFHLNRRST